MKKLLPFAMIIIVLAGCAAIYGNRVARVDSEHVEGIFIPADWKVIQKCIESSFFSLQKVARMVSQKSI